MIPAGLFSSIFYPPPCIRRKLMMTIVLSKLIGSVISVSFNKYLIGLLFSDHITNYLRGEAFQARPVE